jgi:predicted nucleic acid-binding protein
LSRRIKLNNLALTDRVTRVYLDTSAYNRPLDDLTQPKIFLEAQAVAIILQMIGEKELDSIGSSVLDYENSKNSNLIKREAMTRYLQLADFRQEVNDNISRRAEELGSNGIKVIDALHIACAEAAGSNYFITCDKRLINRCVGLTMKVINPVDFILEIGGNDSSQK